MPTIWKDLYWKTWAGILPDKAYAHPAKFAPGLIEEIVRYLRYDLAVPQGSVILDPFAGVATGALFAMLNGYNWIGHEIEENFYRLAANNIFEWEQTYYKHYKLGKAVILNRDSSEGPYNYNKVNLRALITSPPFGRGETRNRSSYQDGEIASQMTRAYTIDNQGKEANNLAKYKEDMAIFRAIISSPPYENSIGKGDGPGVRWDAHYHSEDKARKVSNLTKYGRADGQMGNAQADDFWNLAADVVRHSYNALQPGGYAIWVCKDFVRDKQRVPFSDNWQTLCQWAGFELHERIYASLVTDNGTQTSMFSNDNQENLPTDEQYLKERKTFFRRHAEAKGSPRIDHEDVIVMRKPGK